MAEGTIRTEDHLGLVHTCAKRFKGRGIDYEDLFQAGCVGLVKAAEHFDVSLGYQFSTYAVPLIIGEIKRLFRDGGAVKISRGLKSLSLRITRETQSFSHRYGREPTVGELAERLHQEPEQIAEAIAASRQPLSLTTDDDGNESQTDIPVDSPDESIVERLSLETELQRLPPEDRQLLQYRFFQGMTQTQTASLLHTSQVQISRREKKLLLLLRSRLL